MIQGFCIDTSIWVDLIENRTGFNDEPLGEYAQKLFYMILVNQQKIFVSDILQTELRLKYSIPEINSMINPFGKNVRYFSTSKEQHEEAKRIALERNVPPGDALHAIIARDNNLVLISRDRHFLKLDDIAQHYKPEDII